MESIQHQNMFIAVGRVAPSKRFPNGSDLTYTKGGTALLNINLAIEEQWQQGGEAKSRKTFVPIKVWGKYAESVADSLQGNAVIKAICNYRTGSYEKTDGTKVYTHEFHSNKVEVLGVAGAPVNRPPAQAQAQAQAQTPPAVQPSQTVDAPPPVESDDEIPF
jgi:single-stranded DNA-binding protein